MANCIFDLNDDRRRSARTHPNAFALASLWQRTEIRWKPSSSRPSRGRRLAIVLDGDPAAAELEQYAAELDEEIRRHADRGGLTNRAPTGDPVATSGAEVGPAQTLTNERC
jgi:hypothetical protein